MPNSPTKELRLLVKQRQSCIFVPSDEENRVLDAVRNTIDHHDKRKRLPLCLWDAIWGLRDGWLCELQNEITEEENSRKLLIALRTLLASSERLGVVVFFDANSHLNDPYIVRAIKTLILRARDEKSTLVFVDSDDRWSASLKRMGETCQICLPNGSRIRRHLLDYLRNHNQTNEPIDIDVKRSTLDAIVRNLQGLNLTQIERVLDQCLQDKRFSNDDLEQVLTAKKRLLHADGLLESVDTPQSLVEIGGLEHLKIWLGNRHHALGEQATEWNLRPVRGVMMLGVQGAGKSLCAKAISVAWKRPLLRLDPSVLYDRYIGESESRLRQALAQAEAMAPVILWIDEIEKGFAGAASKSIDGGLSQRMFGTFLTWLQEHRSPVFTVATANNIDALPPELMRKGRFDEIFFVDLPNASARYAIWDIHLKRRNQELEALDMPALIQASEGFSGAEIEQAIESVLYAQLGKDKPDTDAYLAELHQTNPLSVTMAEKITALRQWASSRCVPAG